MQDKITTANMEQVRAANLRGLMAISLQIYLMRFPVIAGLVVLINLPVNIYLILYGPPLPTTTAESLAFMPYLLGSSLFTLLAVLGIAYIVELTIHAEQPGLNDAINHALLRWLPAIGTYLLSTAAILLGSMLFLLPGIILAVFFLFDVYIVSLRELSLGAALRYSRDLVAGHWWQMLGRVLFVMFLVTVPNLFINFSVTASGADLGQTTLIFYDTLLDVIFSFSLVAFTILFLNLEYRAQPNLEESDGTAGA